MMAPLSWTTTRASAELWYRSSMESFVVWNPWEKKCAAIADLKEDDFLKFLCVEPGIIPPSKRELKPGASFEAGMTIEAMPPTVAEKP